MVMFVLKWDVHPDKKEAYLNWTTNAIRRTLAVPGVVEFRAYRVAAGASQVVVTYEFPDLATWAAWYANDETQAVFDELRTVAVGISTEVWGPSPVVPAPIRPAK